MFPPPPGGPANAAVSGGPLRLPPGGVPVIPEADSLLLLGGGLAALAALGFVRAIRQRRS
jgi:hypothetical protein